MKYRLNPFFFRVLVLTLFTLRNEIKAASRPIHA